MMETSRRERSRTDPLDRGALSTSRIVMPPTHAEPGSVRPLADRELERQPGLERSTATVVSRLHLDQGPPTQPRTSIATANKCSSGPAYVPVVLDFERSSQRDLLVALRLS